MSRPGEARSALPRGGASRSSSFRVRLLLPLICAGAVGGCERQPPEPKPLASLAEQADGDGLPFSAACQSWRIADFEKHAPTPKRPSLGRQRLDAIWKGMIKDHLDPTLSCLDWPRVHARQVEELGAGPKADAVDASFGKVLSQLASEAPRLEGEPEPSPTKGKRKVIKGSRAVLVAYGPDGARLPDRPQGKAGSADQGDAAPEPPRKKASEREGPVYVPPGMSLAWWTLGSWTVGAVKQIEGALTRVGNSAESIPTVIDLRDTQGTAIRSALRLLATCTDRDRTLGEINDRKGLRELKVRRNNKLRLGRELLVLTSERSSTVSAFFAYSAVTECGATWWYEVPGKKPDTAPEQARVPVWSETVHGLPGGGQMRVRSSRLDLEARAAGPTPVAELRSVEETGEDEILAHFKRAKGQ